MAHLLGPSFDDGWDGAMFMTELRGGSDLATTETTARPAPGGGENRWLLNGSKWFCSNVDAKAIATLARPEGADPGLRGLALFLVPATRADGTPNSIHIKRVKDKMGTRSVPTAEVDFVDTEAYILSSPKPDSSEGRGFNRMMSMVNGSRLGVAAMGLGIARRCFLEASIYAAHREALGRRLDGLPLVQETLLQMAVEAEAAAAVVFEASSLAGRHGDEEARRLYRIMVPLSKFRAARRGLEVASQGLEVLGGNGYIENWPLARQFRDAQCHTIWEGAENIDLSGCLARSPRSTPTTPSWGASMRRWRRRKHPALASVRGAVEGARAEAIEALTVMATLPQELQLPHARRLTGLLADLTQAALLAEQAEGGIGWRRLGAEGGRGPAVRARAPGGAPPARHLRRPDGAGAVRPGHPPRDAGPEDAGLRVGAQPRREQRLLEARLLPLCTSSSGVSTPADVYADDPSVFDGHLRRHIFRSDRRAAAVSE